MNSYFYLKYIFIINKINANLKSFDFIKNICINEKNKIVRILYIIISGAKFFLGKFIWYVLFMPLFLYIIQSIVHMDDLNTNFPLYYYYVVFFFQIASKISKSKVISAEEIEYHFIKTFRYPPRQFVKIKKKITILDIFIESIFIGFIFIYLGIECYATIGAIFIVLIINFSFSIIFLKTINTMKEKYLSLKYPLTIFTNLFIPLIGMYMVCKFNLHLYEPSLLFCILSFLLILGEVLLFYNTKNEEQLCRLILKEYYYDNSLLESIDKDKLSLNNLEEKPSRTGFEYFNYIFFSSHKGIIIKNCIGKCIILMGCSILYFFCDLQISMQTWNWIISLLPLMLYQLSPSSKICTMFWKNCDINMYGHNFYKSKEAQLELKKYRLKSLLSINGILSVLFLVIVSICMNIARVNFPIRYLALFFSAIIIIMVLHSLFDFSVYYYFKPHANKKMGWLISYFLKIVYLSVLGGIMIII